MKNNISGFKEFSEQTNNENRPKSDRPSLSDIRKKLSSDCRQNNGDREKMENYEEIRKLQETNKLRTLLCCLLGTITNLLQIKIELILIKNQSFKNAVINVVEDVQLKVNDAFGTFFMDSAIRKDSKLQEIQNLVESSSLHMTREIIDLKQILEKADNAFLEFQTVYKNSKSVLEAFVQDIESKLKNKNVSNIVLEKQNTYFMILEDIVSQKYFLADSIKSFEEFEYLIKHFMNIPIQDAESRIDVLLVAIYKAESACIQLKSFTCVLQNFEYANV